ncbi:DNA (cytosine-5-)-methyltransferase [Fusarium mundagurra]|uniref:DNA (Cytosine-5-)-methyltransferase n=1 Tax=Fusarium mundagurra TaxID=1567541 RepID=A0A8H5Z519_9HYPO|nr:DNA (cytosine-5-)-methyltransferase [Fusarium mundagurra]
MTQTHSRFICNQLLKRLRPGIVTADQALDLTRTHHEEAFNGLIGDFTKGYSVCWQGIRLFPRRKVADLDCGGIWAHSHSSPRRCKGAILLPYSSTRKAPQLMRLCDELREIDSERYFNLTKALHRPRQLAETVTTRTEDLSNLANKQKRPVVILSVADTSPDIINTSQSSACSAVLNPIIAKNSVALNPLPFKRLKRHQLPVSTEHLRNGEPVQSLLDRPRTGTNRNANCLRRRTIALPMSGTPKKFFSATRVATHL